ncbi:uncharacterized protein LOC123513252 [Portunus trituberculatus]|uniref:Uncharacterized protein n=1 Tax=Portunus trituberculatus TaxID=210409 RepID=A0A5B7FNH9_PORTR|nr:uncharacterized protein LOC123513252 [Portunus trituberculatus]MPC46799.1 hypothetical protein [Portunus trituberculatus]
MFLARSEYTDCYKNDQNRRKREAFYHSGSVGPFGTLGSGTQSAGPAFIGGSGQFLEDGSPSSRVDDNNRNFPGVIGPGVALVGLTSNAFSTLDTVPGQVGAGVISLPPQQGPAFTGQGGIISVPSRQGPAFIGSQGGVIPLPSQQGPAFIGGQGGSFVGGQVFGQASAPGAIFQQGGAQAGGIQAAGFGFSSRVIQQEATPTVTRTFTVDAFETLTDLVLHSVAVTRTQFSIVTVTRATTVIVATPVNHGLALTTSVVVSPAYVTVTDTKSDFRVVVRTSVSHVTLTHTSYDITHVPFTLTSTEIVTMTSPVVRTVISTSVEAVTNYHTATNAVYVHGGYH